MKTLGNPLSGILGFFKAPMNSQSDKNSETEPSNNSSKKTVKVEKKQKNNYKIKGYIRYDIVLFRLEKNYIKVFVALVKTSKILYNNKLKINVW